jgi:hypothetical protein
MGLVICFLAADNNKKTNETAFFSSVIGRARAAAGLDMGRRRKRRDSP